MALLDVHFEGPSIGKQSSMQVLIPPGKGPFPVLYLLHGLSDDHTIWLRRTSLERYMAGLDLIIVLPDGHRSFYVNDPRPGGMAYEDHITRDVVGFCDRVFPTIPKREARAVAGQSMGGYGAMMLALKNPTLFGTAVSHSGALAFSHDPKETRADFEPLARELGGRYDCFRLAARLLKSGKRHLPAIRFDCGADDFLLAHSRRFESHLTKIGASHEYQEHPGNHSWAYWDAHIQDTVSFVMRQFKKR
ncbi:MAG: alpha/beta hydrolase family protein [Kiritimatiellia bacterium]